MPAFPCIHCLRSLAIRLHSRYPFMPTIALSSSIYFYIDLVSLPRYHVLCYFVSSFFSYDYHFWQFVKIIAFPNMRTFNITFVVDRLEWDYLLNGKTCIIQVHIFLERNMNCMKYRSLVMSFPFNLKSEHNYHSQLFYS